MPREFHSGTDHASKSKPILDDDSAGSLAAFLLDADRPTTVDQQSGLNGTELSGGDPSAASSHYSDRPPAVSAGDAIAIGDLFLGDSADALADLFLPSEAASPAWPGGREPDWAEGAGPAVAIDPEPAVEQPVVEQPVAQEPFGGPPVVDRSLLDNDDLLTETERLASETAVLDRPPDRSLYHESAPALELPRDLRCSVEIPLRSEEPQPSPLLDEEWPHETTTGDDSVPADHYAGPGVWDDWIVGDDPHDLYDGGLSHHDRYGSDPAPPAAGSGPFGANGGTGLGRYITPAELPPLATSGIDAVDDPFALTEPRLDAVDSGNALYPGGDVQPGGDVHPGDRGDRAGLDGLFGARSVGAPTDGDPGVDRAPIDEDPWIRSGYNPGVGDLYDGDDRGEPLWGEPDEWLGPDEAGMPPATGVGLIEASIDGPIDRDGDDGRRLRDGDADRWAAYQAGDEAIERPRRSAVFDAEADDDEDLLGASRPAQAGQRWVIPVVAALVVVGAIVILWLLNDRPTDSGAASAGSVHVAARLLSGPG